MAAIDATGVGAPVIDMIKETAQIDDIYAITITGGHEVGKAPYRRTVPKPDLINKIAILFQQRRVRIAAGLNEAPALLDELRGYRVKINDNRHYSYEPASSSDHDDLLLALALALWIAEHIPAPTPAQSLSI